MAGEPSAAGEPLPAMRLLERSGAGIGTPAGRRGMFPAIPPGGWVLDKSAAARADDPVIGVELAELVGALFVCPVGELEQLYSARSAADYDGLKSMLHANFEVVAAPPDILDRALRLQRDLAHYHGMWHRTPIPDLLIAETALFHGLGVVHVDGDFSRIAEVRPLIARRLGIRSDSIQ